MGRALCSALSAHPVCRKAINSLFVLERVGPLGGRHRHHPRAFTPVCLTSSFGQALLYALDLSFQSGRIKRRIFGPQLVLPGFAHQLCLQDALIGCQRLVILLLYSAPHPFFGLELHGGEKEISVEPQITIQLIEQLTLGIRVVARVTDGAAHDRIVLLLYKTTIILAIGTRTSEADPLLLTVT